MRRLERGKFLDGKKKAARKPDSQRNWSRWKVAIAVAAGSFLLASCHDSQQESSSQPNKSSVVGTSNRQSKADTTVPLQSFDERIDELALIVLEGGSPTNERINAVHSLIEIALNEGADQRLKSRIVRILGKTSKDDHWYASDFVYEAMCGIDKIGRDKKTDIKVLEEIVNICDRVMNAYPESHRTAGLARLLLHEIASDERSDSRMLERLVNVWKHALGGTLGRSVHSRAGEELSHIALGKRTDSRLVMEVIRHLEWVSQYSSSRLLALSQFGRIIIFEKGEERSQKNMRTILEKAQYSDEEREARIAAQQLGWLNMYEAAMEGPEFPLKKTVKEILKRASCEEISANNVISQLSRFITKKETDLQSKEIMVKMLKAACQDKPGALCYFAAIELYFISGFEMVEDSIRRNALQWVEPRRNLITTAERFYRDWTSIQIAKEHQCYHLSGTDRDSCFEEADR